MTHSHDAAAATAEEAKQWKWFTQIQIHSHAYLHLEILNPRKALSIIYAAEWESDAQHPNTHDKWYSHKSQHSKWWKRVSGREMNWNFTPLSRLRISAMQFSLTNELKLGSFLPFILSLIHFLFFLYFYTPVIIWSIRDKVFLIELYWIRLHGIPTPAAPSIALVRIVFEIQPELRHQMCIGPEMIGWQYSL